MHPRTLLLVPLALLGGCRAAPPPRPTPAPPPVAGTPGEAAPEWSISSGKAGKIRLGMKLDEARRASNITAVTARMKLDGRDTEVVSISQFGMPLMMGEVKQGQITALRIYHPRFRTENGGLGPGSRAKELAQKLGAGKMTPTPSGKAVTFAASPGVTYYFARGARGKDWPELVRANPQVLFVRLVQR